MLVIKQCLSMNPDVKKVWQKMRSFSEKYTAIAYEVDRLLAMRFIREAY